MNLNLEEWIATEKICVHYQVDNGFIKALGESGIIELHHESQKDYIRQEQLAEIEKMQRLHRDLHINLEGLEAIHHLLERVNDLQESNRELRNRLRLYTDF